MKIMLNSGRISPFFTTRKKLLESMKEAGYQITVSGYTTDSQDLCDAFGAEFVRIPLARAGLNPVSDLKVLWAYYRNMRACNYDIVHSYTAKPNIYGSIAAKLAGVKKIYPTVNGLGYAFTNDTESNLKAKVVRTVVSVLYKIAFGCATKVFFQNVDDAQEMINRKIVKPEKCVVIAGSGIDLNAFPYSACNTEPIRFFMATRLLVTKGVRTYFEAARIVKNKYPDAVFRLAGSLDPNPDGIKEEELKSYTQDGTIDYLGVIKDMSAALTDCSVFVLPSYYREGVPHAILEAMSTGRAVITTDRPGCKETVNGKNGFLIEAKNSQELAEKMIWMIEHPEDVEKMGRESRKYAEEKFDVDIVNQMMMDTMGVSSNKAI